MAVARIGRMILPLSRDVSSPAPLTARQADRPPPLPVNLSDSHILAFDEFCSDLCVLKPEPSV